VGGKIIMTYEQFEDTIKRLEEISITTNTLHSCGIDLLDYNEKYYTIITTLLNSIFKLEGKDWIDWYLYERPGFGEGIGKAWDENNNEICHNIPSLWDTVKPYLK
jgi:hypothetical protein